MNSEGSGFDSSAIKESQAIAAGDLEGEARKNAHERGEKIKNHVSRAAVMFFWFAIIILFIMAFSWSWHLLTPIEWHYLADEKVNQIQTIIFSGALASIVPAYAKKYL